MDTDSAAKRITKRITRGPPTGWFLIDIVAAESGVEQWAEQLPDHVHTAAGSQQLQEVGAGVVWGSVSSGVFVEANTARWVCRDVLAANSRAPLTSRLPGRRSVGRSLRLSVTITSGAACERSGHHIS